jgi:hypothetical protein
LLKGSLYLVVAIISIAGLTKEQMGILEKDPIFTLKGQNCALIAKNDAVIAINARLQNKIITLI